MPLNSLGLLTPIQFAAEQHTVLYAYLREIFVNETPLVARLPRTPVPSETYNITTYDVRPRTYTLNGALLAGDAVLTLTDATPLLVGDVLEIRATGGATFERVECTSDPGATTIAIRRAREGTAAVANDNTGNKTITLVGNSRTGAEVDQNASRAIRTLIPQNVQTYEFPVQVGGKANAISNNVLPAGIPDVFTFEQKVKMTEMMRDEEYGMMFGIGEAPAAVGDRAKQAGLKKLIGYYKSNANVQLAAGASYTKLNFIANGAQKALDGGGNPDLILCSTNFMGGLATWGINAQSFTNPVATPFLGIPIKSFVAPFLGQPMTFLPSYQMPAGSAFVLTTSDIRVRYIRQEGFTRRGNRGDALEGDFLSDVCIELGHPGWHAYIEGITTFA